MYLRMRLIVTRRQQVAVARQFFEACRGYGGSTSVHEEMLREIEKLFVRARVTARLTAGRTAHWNASQCLCYFGRMDVDPYATV
jgi:hypothetical protein